MKKKKKFINNKIIIIIINCYFPFRMFTSRTYTYEISSRRWPWRNGLKTASLSQYNFTCFFRDARSLREFPLLSSFTKINLWKICSTRCTMQPANPSRCPRDSHVLLLIIVFVIHAAVHVNCAHTCWIFGSSRIELFDFSK